MIIRDVFEIVKYGFTMITIAIIISAAIFAPLSFIGYHWTGKVEKTMLVDVVKVKHEYVPLFDVYTTTIYSADDVTLIMVGDHQIGLGVYMIRYNQYMPFRLVSWFGVHVISVREAS